MLSPLFKRLGHTVKTVEKDASHEPAPPPKDDDFFQSRHHCNHPSWDFRSIHHLRPSWSCQNYRYIDEWVSTRARMPQRYPTINKGAHPFPITPIHCPIDPITLEMLAAHPERLLLTHNITWYMQSNADMTFSNDAHLGSKGRSAVNIVCSKQVMIFFENFNNFWWILWWRFLLHGSVSLHCQLFQERERQWKC